MKSTNKSIISGKLFERAYSLDNYLIELNKTLNTGICAVYISSSAIYYPNTEEEFKKKILDEDAYEWYNTRFKNAEKHIFIRDIAKQFYITGINYKYNTIDKLIEMLRLEIEGYDLYVVGSSAGGYLASVLGTMLNAHLILCFSGYFNLNIIDTEIWFYINEYKNDIKRSKYYKITELLNDYKGKMIYFYPSKLEGDVLQSQQIVETAYIIKIPIVSKIHGVPVPVSVIKRLMDVSAQDLDKCLMEVQKFKGCTPRQITIQEYGFVKGNYVYYREIICNRVLRIMTKIENILRR